MHISNAVADLGTTTERRAQCWQETRSANVKLDAINSAFVLMEKPFGDAETLGHIVDSLRSINCILDEVQQRMGMR